MAKEQDKKTKKGKTPKELMDKHLKNKDDKITEEEFRDMEVGVDVDTTGEQQELIIPDKKDRPKDEDKDPVTNTPWDILK